MEDEEKKVTHGIRATMNFSSAYYLCCGVKKRESG